MDLIPLSPNINMANVQPHGEWTIKKTKIIRGTVCHAYSHKTEFVQISYKLALDRKALYYIANFLLPCVLIALITILLFLIPPRKFYIYFNAHEICRH